MKMKSLIIKFLPVAFVLFFPGISTVTGQVMEQKPYIEVVGTSELEIVPDKIHFIIEIKEYFEEEFDGKSKPEQYRTKVPLERIEQNLSVVLQELGIPQESVRTQEIGDYWRQQGQDFLVSKRFDIVLDDFRQVDALAKKVDTKGIHSMRIGELENGDMPAYHRKGKTMALEAAREKAAYLLEAVGKKLGGVLMIVEEGPASSSGMYVLRSNAKASDTYEFDGFRTIRKLYSFTVRFEIAD